LGQQCDLLYSQGGDDILWGGTGNDRLEGGAGDDTYLFNRGDGFDALLSQENEFALMYCS
jgi:Ca2+-binding RTX toxin-like protein